MKKMLMKTPSVISKRNLLPNLYLTWVKERGVKNHLNNTPSFLILAMQFLCNTTPTVFEAVTAWPPETQNLANLLQLKLPLSGCQIKIPPKHTVGTALDPFWRQFRALIVQVGTLSVRGLVGPITMFRLIWFHYMYNFY